MSNLAIPDIRQLKPRITVFGVGGAGGNALNNMINAGLQGVDFVVANTDSQALGKARAERIIQMGVTVTEGLGAGSQPDVGRAAAEEVIDEIRDHLTGAHMVFVTAGMGGGTGTGASPVVARAARELGILTVGVVTKPFHFEGQRRMRLAESGIMELQKSVDTLRPTMSARPGPRTPFRRPTRRRRRKAVPRCKRRRRCRPRVQIPPRKPGRRTSTRHALPNWRSGSKPTLRASPNPPK
jgi:Tubulin/FtsZ family, GTPase domain